VEVTAVGAVCRSGWLWDCLEVATVVADLLEDSPEVAAEVVSAASVVVASVVAAPAEAGDFDKLSHRFRQAQSPISTGSATDFGKTFD